MLAHSKFKCCPSCASPKIAQLDTHGMLCKDCGYTFFLNAAAAVAGLLRSGDKLLFVRRGKNPGEGKLGLPGGFVDYDERAEDAVRREVLEETGFTIKNLRYFSSGTNHYEFKNVLYHTCDLCFTGEIENPEHPFVPNAEVAELLLLKPAEIDLQQIAFESLRSFTRKFLAELSA